MSKKRTALLGSLRVGSGFPVRVMAAINLSPESFYKGSVASSVRDVSKRAERAVEEGAEILDIGGMSTAPYLSTSEVSEELETERIRSAVPLVTGLGAQVSVDTVRASVAEVALRLGASAVNDVSGLKNDPRMASVVRDSGASLIVMAHSTRKGRGRPITQVRSALRETLSIASSSGVEAERVIVDPGIGFFRDRGAGRAFSPQDVMHWYEWDGQVIDGLSELWALGRPVCVGLSRKSFIGKILGLDDAEDRLIGSVAATAIAAIRGADLVRTHDVKETIQAVRVAEAITRRGPGPRRVA